MLKSATTLDKIANVTGKISETITKVIDLRQQVEDSKENRSGSYDTMMKSNDRKKIVGLQNEIGENVLLLEELSELKVNLLRDYQMQVCEEKSEEGHKLYEKLEESAPKVRAARKELIRLEKAHNEMVARLINCTHSSGQGIRFSNFMGTLKELSDIVKSSTCPIRFADFEEIERKFKAEEDTVRVINGEKETVNGYPWRGKMEFSVDEYGKYSELKIF